MNPPASRGAGQREHQPQHQPQGAAAPSFYFSARPSWVPERLPDCVPGPRLDHKSTGARPTSSNAIGPAILTSPKKTSTCSIDTDCKIENLDASRKPNVMCSIQDQQVPFGFLPGPAPVPNMFGVPGYWNPPFDFNMGMGVGMDIFEDDEVEIKLEFPMDPIPDANMFAVAGREGAGAHDLPGGPVFLGEDGAPQAPPSDVPRPRLPQPTHARRAAANNGNPQNIPLICYACPKQPRFSDQSHLLTHICSKSHLSALFSLGLSEDAASQQRRDQYANWEKTYGIKTLLKGRQETKELKKQDKKKRQRGNGNERTRRSAGAQESVKTEPDASFDLSGHLDANPLNQNGWHVHTPRDNDGYQTPSSKRDQSIYPLPDTPKHASYIDDQAATQAQGPNSVTPKLKGSIWPGMNIFDSATPEMKRMRNQKKHGSVLENMALHSQSIQQDEFVWDNDMFAITRTRNVYDSPSVDGSQASDNEEAAEKPQKKRRARRAAVSVPAGQRQTRTATRGRAATRGTTRAAAAGRKGTNKTGLKIEPELDSDGEEQDLGGTNVAMNAAGNAAVMMGDVFDGRPQGMEGVAGNPFNSEQNMPNSLQMRSAMGNLPSNRSMYSMFGRQDDPSQYAAFAKENDRNVFPVQQNNAMSGYFNQQRQGMQSGVGNPLCVRPDSFNPYMFAQGFDASKSMAPAAGFPAMNGMNYAAYGTNSHGGMANAMHNNMGNVTNGGLNGGQYQAGNNSGQTHGAHGGFEL